MSITTNRLTLRPFEDSDAQDVIAILRDPCVGKTYMVPDLTDNEVALRLFNRFRDLSHDDSRVVLAVALDGKVIGFINDTGIDGTRIELGYAFSPAHHNRGYATEALTAMIQTLFTRGFEEIICGAFAQNVASLRVMEKSGMRPTGETEEIAYRGQTHRCVYCSIKRNA